MRILLLIITITCICLTGCGNTGKTGKGNGTVLPDEPGIYNNNDQVDILQVIAEDKEFDGKSVIWDGEKVQVVDDELDNRNVMDGRYGEFEFVTLKTKLGFDLVLPNTGHNSDLFLADKYPVIDTDDEYNIETPGRFLSIKRESIDSFNQKEAELLSDQELIESSNEAINSEMEHKLFTGIINTTSGEDMIGFLLLIPGEDSVYLFRYAGIGNYSDIRVEAFNTMRRFLNQF